MKYFFKRIAASALAATAIAANVVAAASAATVSLTDYPDIDSWKLTMNPGIGFYYDDVKLTSYGNGYMGCTTYKAGDCTINYVTIMAPNMQDVVIGGIGKENGRALKPTKIDNNYITFDVKFTFLDGIAAINYGDIMIKPLWDQYEC